MRDSPPVAHVATLIIVVAIVYAGFTRQAFDFGADPAMYAGLARSIVSGDGYWFNGRPHTLYPPGYPLLLAPVSVLAGHSFAVLAVFTALIAAGGIAVTAWYGRLRLGRLWFAPALLLVLSAPYFAHATSGVESEAPYLAVSVAFLACVERMTRPGSAAPAGYVIATPLLLVASMAIRGVGIALLPAAAVTLVTLFVSRHELDGRAWRRARLALGSAIVAGAAYFAAWSLWTRTMRQPLYEGEYADLYAAQLSMVDPRRPDMGTATLWDMLQRIPQGVVNQSAHTAELLTNIGWFLPVWYLAPVLIVLLCGVSGIVIELRRRNPMLGWYLAAYVGVLSLWPFDDGVRFMLPVLPVMAIAVARGAALWWRWLAAGVRPALALLGLVAVAGIGGTIASGGGYTRQEQLSLVLWLALLPGALIARRLASGDRSAWLRSTGVLVTGAFVLFAAIGSLPMASTIRTRLDRSTIGRNEGVRQAAEWLRRNASPEAVVMADAAPGVHYATGMRTVPFPVTFDPGRMRAVFERLRPDLLVVEAQRPFEYFLPTQVERLEIIRANDVVRLRELAVFEGARLYAVNPSSPVEPNAESAPVTRSSR